MSASSASSAVASRIALRRVLPAALRTMLLHVLPAAFIAALSALVTAPAAAQAAPLAQGTTVAPVDWLWSASVGADTDYRFRGVSLSDGKPSLRLALDVDHASGAYGGVAVTRIEPTHDDRYELLRWQLGYARRLESGASIDVGIAQSHFTGDARYDYLELQAGYATADWSLRANVAPDYFGRGVRTLYLEAQAQRPFGERWRAYAHAGALLSSASSASSASEGWRDAADDAARRSRYDLRLGVAWTLRGLDLQLAWAGATRGGPYPATYDGRRATWLASATWSF